MFTLKIYSIEGALPKQNSIISKSNKHIRRCDSKYIEKLYKSKGMLKSKNYLFDKLYKGQLLPVRQSSTNAKVISDSDVTKLVQKSKMTEGNSSDEKLYIFKVINNL